jgi:hypothetical protein
MLEVANHHHFLQVIRLGKCSFGGLFKVAHYYEACGFLIELLRNN